MRDPYLYEDVDVLVNLANIKGAQLTAGLVGNVGTGTNSMYFDACKNYGAITSLGTDYNGVAGGIIARSSNLADQGGKRLRVFYDCVNYGTVRSGARAGGILGTSHDWDTNGKNNSYSYYTFENCINYGQVSGDAYAGGIMGIAGMFLGVPLAAAGYRILRDDILRGEAEQASAEPAPLPETESPKPDSKP